MQKTIDFSTFSSIRIGPTCKVEVLSKIEPISKDTYIIGGCNNLLVSPTPPPLAVLGKEFDFITLKEDGLHVGGATKSGKILSFAKKHDLADFELMQKLPGTIGGMIKMNAGLKEWEIFNNLKKILTCKGWINKEDIDYSYRYTNIQDVVYEAVFEVKKGFDFELLEMFKKMRDNQPQNPSCGSCFKNPNGDFAGRLLQEAGLKGKRVGDMAFSQKHANFLINLGNGTYEDALSLINSAKEEVYKKFNVKLELEIIII